MYANDGNLGLDPISIASGGISIIGGLVGGKKTWQETQVAGDLPNCVGAPEMARGFQYATAAEWDQWHQRAVARGWRHLAKAAAMRDPVAFTAHVFEENCNPNRTSYTREAVQFGHRLLAERGSTGGAAPTPAPPTGAPQVPPPAPSNGEPTARAGLGIPPGALMVGGLLAALTLFRR